MRNLYPYTLKITGLLLLYLTLLRIGFWIINRDLIAPYFIDFYLGFRFDLSLIGYFSMALFSLTFILGFLKNLSMAKRMLWAVSFLTFLLVLLPEMWDLIYFNYSLKRTSFDLYAFYLLGEEKSQFTTLLLRFWYVPLLCLFWMFSFIFILKKVALKKVGLHSRRQSALKLILYLILTFVCARNSFGPKPLGIADALIQGNPVRAQLSLNSAFVVLKTIQNNPLPNIKYLKKKEEFKHVNPIHRLEFKEKEQKPNLVFIIIESLGSRQLHLKRKGQEVTPFLDELALKQSNQNGETCLSAGKTSIECMPALFAGIPSLQETPFILSNYSTNELNGFASICRQKGYQTYFFHGAERGSMRFDAMANSLGFQHLFFKKDMHGSQENIGSWGYHDNAVLKEMGDQFQHAQQPFMAAFFSLSSHEPYDIPHRDRKKIKNLNSELASYRFTDNELRKFFKKNRHKSWFKNTMFIITGDHPPVHLDNSQYRISDYYSVPIFILPPENMGKLSFTVNEHAEIVPAICRALRWKTRLYDFSQKDRNETIRFLNGIYYIWNNDYEIQFNETKQSWSVIIKNVKKRSHSDKKLLILKIEASKKHLLALLQKFRRDLRSNGNHP